MFFLPMLNLVGGLTAHHFLCSEHICLVSLCFQQIMINKIHSVLIVHLIKGSHQDMRVTITNHQMNLIGWILFLISAISFCITSIGNFWAMFDSIFFLVACLVCTVPFLRTGRRLSNGH